MPMKFLIQFAQYHAEFRFAELESLAILEKVHLRYDPNEYSNESPFFVVEMNSVEDAKTLAQRAILIKSIMELYETRETLDDLIETLKAAPKEQLLEFKVTSFKFNVDVFGSTVSLQDQIEIIERFEFLPLNGKIDLKNPKEVFTLHFDYGCQEFLPSRVRSDVPLRVFFGRLVAKGSRQTVNKYDLKKRKYLGTTSMDAELSLIMANQALVQSDSLVLDPFVGTGSFLITCSHFGAFTLGSDIDGQQIRGKDGESIESNVKQYNLGNRIMGNVVCDFAHHPWRNAEFLDAIVCDPPYGVRAGAKKIRPTETTPFFDSNAYKSDGGMKYPETEVYDMENILIDLVEFSAKLLVVGGRLVFWLPTARDTYKPEDIPVHPQFRLVANSEQNFGKWARRLITMEKIVSDANGVPMSAPNAPGHARFRERYFAAFNDSP